MPLHFRDAQKAHRSSADNSHHHEGCDAFESIDQQLKETMSARLLIGQGSPLNPQDIAARYRAEGWCVFVDDDLADRSSTVVIGSFAAFNLRDYAE